MPAHWFAPLKSSDPATRKEEVKAALSGHGSLQSFWKGDDGNLYALIKDCPNLDSDQELKKNLKVAGQLIGLEKEV